MIAITKAEKDTIRERFPDVHIVRTMKQKSKRHHYYCEELRPVMNYLNKLRNGGSVTDGRQRGGTYAHRKTGNRV